MFDHEEIDDKVYFKMMRRMRKLGVSPAKTVYKLVYEDVLCVLADTLGPSIADLTDEQLSKLMRAGMKAAETLPWYETIQIGIDMELDELEIKVPENEDD